MNLEKLKKDYKEALNWKSLEDQRKREIELAKAKKSNEEEVRKFQRLVTDSEEIINEAVKKAEENVSILVVDNWGDMHHYDNNTGKPKALYLLMTEEWFKNKGFTVSFEFRHDGCGMKSWYELVLSGWAE